MKYENINSQLQSTATNCLSELYKFAPQMLRIRCYCTKMNGVYQTDLCLIVPHAYIGRFWNSSRRSNSISFLCEHKNSVATARTVWRVDIRRYISERC